ncbi:hypothetical protein N2152v2_011115 [Parachlorella kessleri]
MTSSDAQDTPSQVECVIFDLDGTVLDTESLVLEVAKTVCERHGKQLTPEAARASLGRTPLDAWQTVADMLGIECTAQQLFEESEPLLVKRWHEAPLLPGVQRLISHLQAHKVPLALATSTPRATLVRKLSAKSQVHEAFASTCCGDEVVKGKPAPECFLRAAQGMGVAQTACLVIEDSPIGVEAAIAAGMRVVAVPSMIDHASFPKPDPGSASGCVSLLPSLLDFRPELYGLPPFEDYVGETIPMQPVWRIKGTVVKGFGRGSKQLGIPTANLEPASLQGALADAVTGIYAGWASVGSSPAVYKMAMSIGYNPVFQNKEKTAEPWLLHDFGPDWSCLGQELRLPPTQPMTCPWLQEKTAEPWLLHDFGPDWSCLGEELHLPPTQPMTCPWLQEKTAEPWLLHDFGPDWSCLGEELRLPPTQPMTCPWLQEKTAEPWLLHDFGPDWSCLGQELRLVVCAYIRPEANFESLQASGQGAGSPRLLANDGTNLSKANTRPGGGHGCAADVG